MSIERRRSENRTKKRKEQPSLKPTMVNRPQTETNSSGPITAVVTELIRTLKPIMERTNNGTVPLKQIADIVDGLGIQMGDSSDFVRLMAAIRAIRQRVKKSAVDVPPRALRRTI